MGPVGAMGRPERDAVSPELALVDPELARRLRERLPAVIPGSCGLAVGSPRGIEPPAPIPPELEAVAGTERRGREGRAFAAGVAAAVVAAFLGGITPELRGADTPLTVGACMFPDGACAGTSLASGERVGLQGTALPRASTTQAPTVNVRSPRPSAVGSAARQGGVAEARKPTPEKDASAVAQAPPRASARAAIPGPPSARATRPASRRVMLRWRAGKGASFYRVRVHRVTAGRTALRVEAYPTSRRLDVGPYRLQPGRYLWDAATVAGTRAQPRVGPRVASGAFTIRSRR
jgi:hypothetical protein